MRSLILAMALISFASQVLASGCNCKIYKNPRVKTGQYVDRCLNPGTDCGQPAADRYCQMKGFRVAQSFEVIRGRVGGYILGTGQECDLSWFGYCDRFSYITCFPVFQQ